MIKTLVLLFIPLNVVAEQWFTVQQEDRPVTVSASGIVVSTDVTHFGPPPGKSWSSVISQLAREGQRVKKGDLLVQFDGSSLDDDVRQRAGNLAVARGELESLIEVQSREIEDEKVVLAAAESLSKKANRKAEQPAELIASMDYDKLIEEKRIANILLQRARQRAVLSKRVREAKRLELEAKIREHEIRLASETAELEAFTIHSPRSGLVMIGMNDDGEKLDVGSQTHPGTLVVRVVDDTKLAVQAEIQEHSAAQLETDQRVRVVVDSAGSAKLNGRVSAVANTVRRKSRNSLSMVRDITVKLAGDLPGTLRLGTSVQITVEIATLKDVIAIPVPAVRYRSGVAGVMLPGNKWQPVVLGERSQNMFIVKSGLTSGQEILM